MKILAHDGNRHFGGWCPYRPRGRDWSKLPGGGADGRGQGVGEPPLGAARKKPRSVAGFFRLERLFVHRLSVAYGSRFEFVFDIREAAVEARFCRIYSLLQALEAARDGNCDIVSALVNNALDSFDVFVV